MKTILAKILTGITGIIVTPLLAKGIVAVVAWMAAFAPESAAAIDQASLLQWLNGLIVSLITYFVIKPERKVTREIQAAANLEVPEKQRTPVDGISHEETKATVLAAMGRSTFPGGPFNPRAKVRRAERA